MGTSYAGYPIKKNDGDKVGKRDMLTLILILILIFMPTYEDNHDPVSGYGVLFNVLVFHDDIDANVVHPTLIQPRVSGAALLFSTGTSAGKRWRG